MNVPSGTPLQQAIAHHQRGELDQAIPIYQQILSQHPNHADALHLLGLASLQRRQPKQAIELIKRAIARTPSEAIYHGNLGEAYRAVGQLDRAAACYQVALRLKPELADVATNFGLVLMRQGRTAQAANLFRQALQHQPDYAVAHNGLGNAYRQTGKIVEALTHFRRAVELSPQFGPAQTNLGQLLLDIGQPYEALPHCREGVRLQPDSAAAHNNLGNALRRLGELTEAKACYTEALRLAPNTPVILDNLGQSMQAERKYEEAVRWYEQALQLEPKALHIRTHLAEALSEKQDFAAAEAQLKIVLENLPDHPEAHFALARMRCEQGRIEEALAEYRSLLQRQPHNVAVNQLLGDLLLELNQPEEAVACFRRSLVHNPTFAPALAQLATHLRDKMSPDEEERLRRLIDEPQLPAPHRAAVHYGLAHLCDARGEYEQAAQLLERANALELAVRNERGQIYNPEVHANFMDGMVQLFTPQLFARTRGFGSDSERPIFIVGLPRSGTTLLEQVIASHSRVHGAGELRLVRDLFEKLGTNGDFVSEEVALEALRVIDADGVRRLADSHLEQLRAINATTDRITDKMPDNYMYLGFLALLFPRARFLYCRRDPRDIAVSCWITQFRTIPWANHPEHLASRFAQHQRIMAHWQEVLPVPVLEVNYEDMVEDLETVAQRALDFCGLSFEPACLEFHRTRRQVKTASVSQVRQPIYRRSLARWRNYEKSMQPLFTRLGFPGDAMSDSQSEESPAEVGAV
ncbi:MAG TPA: tetratricopeptide repeat protein [Gemmataceae bacterium]|nr:tetratricopeptide repeat protein [Gemmataceae bacterium]